MIRYNYFKREFELGSTKIYFAQRENILFNMFYYSRDKLFTLDEIVEYYYARTGIKVNRQTINMYLVSLNKKVFGTIKIKFGIGRYMETENELDDIYKHAIEENRRRDKKAKRRS